MGMVTQEAYFRQRVLNYAAKHGVTAAAIRHHVSRKTVHKWKKRYDGTVESLQDLPRTPHHFPRQQTAAELKLVQRYAKKYKGDPLLGYEKASKHGYKRSCGKETEKAEEQALSTRRVSRAEDADRRKVRAQLLRCKWRKILSVYGQGRVYPLDLPRNVR